MTPREIVERQLTLATHRIRALPVIVLMPHSRCNCRCVMCDIWKANRNRQELSRDDLARHVDAFARLGVRRAVLSGGEALMHSDLWSLCELLGELDIKITLLSTGLLLDRHAAAVTRFCDDVIVSLDGSPAVHDAIRRVPRAYEQLAEGVQALHRASAGFPVSGRCVIQRYNYFDLPKVIDAARDIGLDHISFLAADVSSEAFNRPQPWDGERRGEVALDLDEARAFERLVETTLEDHADDFRRGFVAEDVAKIRRLSQYFLALNGIGDFSAPRCNAPWVSTVIEADGTVRPCFFHPALGNARQQPLLDILNSREAIAFRKELDIERDPTCRRCVCSLELKAWQEI